MVTMRLGKMSTSVANIEARNFLISKHIPRAVFKVGTTTDHVPMLNQILIKSREWNIEILY